MILYITIICVFLLLLFALKAGKSLFSPAVIIIVSYLFSMLLIVPNVEIWNVDLKPKTCLIILIGIISFLFSYFLFFMFHRRDEKVCVDNKYYKLSAFTKFFLVFIQIIALIINYYYISKIVGGITVSNFSSAMEKYRIMSAYSETIVSAPFFARQLKKFVNLLFYFITYIFFENHFNIVNTGHKKNITFLFLLSFIIQIMLSIISAGRYNIICLILGILIMYTICKSKSKRNISKVFKFKDYIKLAMVLLLILLAFSGMRTLVGRTNDSSFAMYISSYFGGSVPLFDKYIDKYESKSSPYFGYNTFYSLCSTLYKFGIVNDVRKPNLEFMQSGLLNGNVYTSFSGMYVDFGIIGIIILQIIEGFICAYFFTKVYLKNDSTKKTVIFIILYCSHISSIFLHSYAENFFNLVVSQSLILEILYIYVAYFFVFRLKVYWKK